MWACTCTIFNWLFSRTNKLNLHCEKRDFSLKKNLHTYLSSLVTFEDNIDKMGMFQYSNIQQWDTRYSSNTKWLMVFLIECKAMCLIRMICQGIRWKVEIVQTTLKWIFWDSDQTIKQSNLSRFLMTIKKTSQYYQRWSFIRRDIETSNCWKK